MSEPMAVPIPGAFVARCRLLRWVPEKKLDPTQLREAREAALPRRYFELDSGRRTYGQTRKGRWETGYPTCGGFSTTDPAAYVAHMLEQHGRRQGQAGRMGYSEAFSRSVRAGWRSPSLAAEGKPLSKDAAALTRRCSTCDLVAEVHGNAGELWWAEHERGCSLAVAS